MAEPDRWNNPTIEGELVILRPIGHDDAQAMFEMTHEPEGNDLTNTIETFTYDQIERWCANRDDQTNRIDVAIVERATGEYAGEAVLNEFDEATESANFRISLRGPRWYSRGLGTEATRLLLDYGLHIVGLREITLEVLERNARARRVYEKIGFTPTGSYSEDDQTWLQMAVRQTD